MKIFYQTGDLIYLQNITHSYIGFTYHNTQSNSYFLIYFDHIIKQIPLRNILSQFPSYHYRRLTQPLHTQFCSTLTKLLEHNTYINIYHILLQELPITPPKNPSNLFKSNLFIYYIYHKMNILHTNTNIHSHDFFNHIQLTNNILLPEIHLNI